VFAIGEGVLLSGTAAGAQGSVPAFAAGTGGATAGLFALTAVRIYAGEVLGPLSSPLPFFAYPFLVATLLAWA
jgi:fructose-1,6-bisphosphatase/sedoheptulose 1,7-bisphosphatase-like protein